MVDYENPLAIQIRKQMVQAISDFSMLQSGDKVLIGVSGGKDSSILLALFKEIQRRAPFDFTFDALLLDQKQPGFQPEAFKNWVAELGVSLTVLERDTYSIVKEKVQGKIYCSLCSRLRRGILYNYAYEHGYTKIALGHHRNDLTETLLLNLFYQGRLSTMPPKLKSDDGRNTIIRPLSYVEEKDLISLSQIWKFPIMPCNLCGSQEGLKRKKMKQLLTQLEEQIPHISDSMLNAMANVRKSQLLDTKLWDFSQADPEADDEIGP